MVDLRIIMPEVKLWNDTFSCHYTTIGVCGCTEGALPIIAVIITNFCINKCKYNMLYNTIFIKAKVKK